LEREGPDHGFLIKVVDLEDVKELKSLGPPGSVTTTRIIVLAATYGEGEPTDNSAEMVQILNEELQRQQEQAEVNPGDSEGVLTNVDYSVFGLGNRQYEHYNAMGKFFHSAFQKLGAKPILPLGLGDDDADLEGDFETWKDELWAALKEKYCKDAVLPTKASKKDGTTQQLPSCEYAIEYHPAGTLAVTVPLDQVHGSLRPFFTAVDCPVTCVKELRTPADGGSTKHVEVDISAVSPDFRYLTADNLGVLPINPPHVVESVAKALGYDLDVVFSLKAANGHEWHGDPFPMPLTVRECLSRYLDLTSAPRRSDLKLLAGYATDRLDRQALLRLASKEGKTEYKEKITQGYVGMNDLLQLCPSLTIPLEHLCSICHWLLPRYYTIASSSSVHPRSIHLTVAVTQDQRPNGSLFEGVCSTHLAQRSPGADTVRLIVRPSTFRLPLDTSTPILMIGPGTGIAPMRALIQERIYQKASGQNVLYFGCKREDQDFLYKDELRAWQVSGALDLKVAFSRVNPSQKEYVQHLLQREASETYHLIERQGAYIYVCGGVKMGHDVTETLKQICVEQGAMSFDQAKDYLAKLAADGRFVQELWA
jgi:NADPH-ferrihemoprotein reductase